MKIAIIGAGFGGMAAAFDLRNAGHDVTIFESADYVGGLASGFKEPHWDWYVEKFYHHWFASDKHMLALIAELGLSDQVIFPRPYTVLLYKGKWYPFDSILQALLFPGLGFGLNKIRFGLVGLYLRLTNNWKPLEKFTVEEWMRKWAGAEVYEQMWQPLVIGKFGPYYKEVNMAWMWARLKARTTKLGTFKGGFQAFADRFAGTLREQGVEIRLGTKVTAIKRGQDWLSVGSARPGSAAGAGEAGTESFDRVLVTTSPNLLTKLCPELPASYLKGLLELKSMGAVVMVLSISHQLSEQGYYWYNLPKTVSPPVLGRRPRGADGRRAPGPNGEAGFPMLALVEHTNFVSSDHFGGDHILYAGDYLVPGHEYFSLSQDELLERFAPAFERINPKFELDWVKKVWVFKTNYAQPVPLVNHSKNIPAIQTPVEGLYFASMSQVYPWDRGTNFAVEIGRRAAKLIQT